MDYKKKYEDALNRAKKLQANTKGLILNKWLYSIFPELKESEDEQMINFINHELACLRATDEKGSDRYKELTNAIAWLEKQSKQKLADKVEPKFKAGDFIINEYGFIMQIDGVDGNLYYYHILDGNCLLKHDITKTEESCHLWTIQDAKDGDVLAYKDEIFLLKSYTLWHKIIYHCCYDGKGLYNHSIYESLIKEDFEILHPATKEQRDILFAKMQEAGYEWDDEKKELKKIEQKPTWSEEDKRFFRSSRCYLNEYGNWLSDKNEEKSLSVYKACDWLKSLEERMKSK